MSYVVISQFSEITIFFFTCAVRDRGHKCTAVKNKCTKRMDFNQILSCLNLNLLTSDLLQKNLRQFFALHENVPKLPKNDQHLKSLYDINTVSINEVLRIHKTITSQILTSNTKTNLWQSVESIYLKITYLRNFSSSSSFCCRLFSASFLSFSRRMFSWSNRSIFRPRSILSSLSGAWYFTRVTDTSPPAARSCTTCKKQFNSFLNIILFKSFANEINESMDVRRSYFMVSAMKQAVQAQTLAGAMRYALLFTVIVTHFTQMYKWILTD